MAFQAGEERRVNTYTDGAQRDQQMLLLADGGWVVLWTSAGQDGDGTGVYQQRYGQDGTPVGIETRVNSTIENSQNAPRAAALANGGWVVTWNSSGQDGDGSGVFQQRYDASGAKAGSETQVNVVTELSQQDPAIVALAGGGWVTYWLSQEDNGTPFGMYRIYHRVYDGDGDALTGEIAAGGSMSGQQSAPSITALEGGGWVALWATTGAGTDVYQEVYNAGGVRIVDQARVNTHEPLNQTGPKVVALEGGGWVVTWESIGQDGDGWGVYQQAYNAAGTAIGTEVLVNFSTVGDQRSQVVAALEGGGWVVTWQSGTSLNPALCQQAFHADGTLLGGQTRIDVTAGGIPQQSVTALDGGGWVVTWSQTSGADKNGYGVYAQAYHADGTADGGIVLVNSETANNQSTARVVAVDGGGWAVTWLSLGQDGSDYGVYQRLFSPSSNHAPTAADDVAAVVEYRSVSGNVVTDAAGRDIDPDGDALNVTVVSGGAVGVAIAGNHGTLTLQSDGSYSYVADRAEPLAVGAKVKDVFTYTISDGGGETDTAKLTITVTGAATGTAGNNHLLGSAKNDTLRGAGRTRYSRWREGHRLALWRQGQ
jgi:VCBS repeat-containing protein